ncbi:MAG TPA: RNA polymerase sigma-70 factor [Gemmatimonadales bacterium]|nr:RNA polymerase sigma-70 factor [Gemmatimonadales bacterium]
MSSPELTPRLASLAQTGAANAVLVARIRTGDVDAFEQLFRDYYNPLCGFAERYGTPPDLAEEIVHAVLARIWERRRSWIVNGSLTAYLYAAVRYEVLDGRRRAAVEARALDQSQRDGTAPGMSAARRGPDEQCEAAELQRAIARAVAHLPERSRLVFILRWQHHLSYAEIAAVLEIAPKTVETQLNRALKALRETLGVFAP